MYFHGFFFPFQNHPQPLSLFPPEAEMAHVMTPHMGGDACRAMQAGRAPPTGARRGSTCFYKHRRAISAKGKQLYPDHFQFFGSHGPKQPEEGGFKRAAAATASRLVRTETSKTIQIGPNVLKSQISMTYLFRSTKFWICIEFYVLKNSE